jgi:hypothetical protein
MRGRFAGRVAVGCMVWAGATGCATRSDVADLSERVDALIASVQQLDAGWLECRAQDAIGSGRPRRSEYLVLMGPNGDAPAGSARELELERQLVELQAEVLGLPSPRGETAAARVGGLIQPQRGELLALHVHDDPEQGRVLRADLLDARQGLPAFWSCRRIPGASEE